MKIGYARVSTQDQKLELQMDELTKYGCEIIFKEKLSGKTRERPELVKMLGQIRKGDVVVVWKLDRLGRSLKDLIDMVSSFREKGVEFVSLKDGIDTATATGRFTFNIFASVAEIEREIIRERTLASYLRSGSCQRNSLNPHERLSDLLAELNDPQYEGKFSDLLPNPWRN
jgi:DNA invertase Pin-like site-specific DNA recombinase